MSSTPQRSSLEGLPAHFLSYIRVLFDIIDEDGDGYILLSDIEGRWQDNDDIDGLPPGVVTALRKVAPTHGRLSFERFVAGLKVALLRSRSLGPAPGSRAEQNHNETDAQQNIPLQSQAQSSSTVTSASGHHRHRQKHDHNPHGRTTSDSTSRRILDQRPSHHSSVRIPAPNTAAVRPNNAMQMSQNRAHSMSQLQDEPQWSDVENAQSVIPAPSVSSSRSSANHTAATVVPSSNTVPAVNSDPVPKTPTRSIEQHRPRQPVRSHEAIENGVARDLPHHHRDDQYDANRLVSKQKRAEPRRHTLASGVDYNMIKRMKQLEQEKDILLQGLEIVERAREWYNQQIQGVQEKQKYIGRGTSSNEYLLESHQEKLNLQLTRITEVNQQLQALLDSELKGLPIHMNLAVTNSPSRKNEQVIKEKETTINMLKDQNKLLTQEVTEKSKRITQLEHEKAQLIKELFQHGSKRQTATYEYDDTTFI